MAPSVGTPRRGRIVPVRLRCSLSTELTWTGEPDGPCAFMAPSPWPCLLSVRGGLRRWAQTVSRKLLLSGVRGGSSRAGAGSPRWTWPEPDDGVWVAFDDAGVRAERGLNDCVVLGEHPGCGFAAWPGFTWNRSAGGVWGAGGAPRAAGPLVTGAGDVLGRGRQVRRVAGSSGVWGQSDRCWAVGTGRWCRARGHEGSAGRERSTHNMGEPRPRI